MKSLALAFAIFATITAAHAQVTRCNPNPVTGGYECRTTRY